MKILNFIWEAWQIEKVKPSDLVILLEDKLEQTLITKKIEYKKVTDYFNFEELDGLNKESIFWLKKWADNKLSGGKNFKEMFSSLDVSLWWFIDFWMFYHETHIITVKESCKFVNIVQKVLETEKPFKVVISETCHYYNDIIKIICKKNGVRVKDRAPSLKVRFNTWKKFQRPYYVEFLKRGKFFSRWLFSRFYGIKPFKKDKQIIFGSFSYNWRKEFDLKQNSVVERDAMVSDIMDIADEKGYTPLLIDIDYSPSIDLGLIKKKEAFARPFESYSNLGIWAESRKEYKRLLGLYRKNRKAILSSFKFNGIPLGRIFRRKFDFAIKYRFRESIMNILIWKNILKEENPLSVLAIDEFGLFGRSANAAAKMMDVKSIGMQHGMVGENSYEYLYLNGEAEGDWRSPGAIVPKYLTTFGDITREFLIDANHNPKNLIVVGQPRYDLLHWMRDNFDKTKLKDKLGIPKEKKAIFLATQPIPGNEKITYEVMKALEGREDVFLIIKTHPREYDLDFYYEYAKKFGIDFKLFKSDLYETLFCSDLLITKNSTVALEAMILDIPSITTNLTGLPDIFPFAKFNCTLQLDSAGLYKDSIFGLLFEEKKRKALLKKQNTFLSKYVYKIDGKASQRIFDLMIN
jgi:hypothetical protein